MLGSQKVFTLLSLGAFPISSRASVFFFIIYFTPSEAEARGEGKVCHRYFLSLNHSYLWSLWNLGTRAAMQWEVFGERQSREHTAGAIPK